MAGNGNRKTAVLPVSSVTALIAGLVFLVITVFLTADTGIAGTAFFANGMSWFRVLFLIFTVGLPAVTAAKIAEYGDQGNYRSAVLTRRVTLTYLAIGGFIASMLFILTAGTAGAFTLGPDAPASDVWTLKNICYLLAPALFLLPLSCSFEVYYCGMREGKVRTQAFVLRMLGTLFSALLLTYFCTTVLQKTGQWPVYMAAVSLSLGLLAGIGWYLAADRKLYPAVAEAARTQSERAVKRKTVTNELISGGIPVMFTLLFFSLLSLISTLFFIRLQTGGDLVYVKAKTMYSILSLQAPAAALLPCTAAVSLAAWIIPRMSQNIADRDYKELQKNIQMCLNKALFIMTPFSFGLVVLSGPVWYILYGEAELNTGPLILGWTAVLGFFMTLTLLSSVMMACTKYRSRLCIYTVIALIIKGLLFWVGIRYEGAVGVILSDIAACIALMFLNFTKIRNAFNISYRKVFNRLFRILIACSVMYGAFLLLDMAGLVFTDVSRLAALAELALFALIGGLLYLSVTDYFRIPQAIYHKSFRQLLSRRKKK